MWMSPHISLVAWVFQKQLVDEVLRCHAQHEFFKDSNKPIFHDVINALHSQI
jgi:hypothetical protein